MSGFQFSLKPKKVEKIKTKYRCIETEIPVPKSIEIFEKLFKYEARSMHGQMPVLWDKAKDSIVYDKFGNKWIDFTSTIFVANSGHGNKEIVKALKKYIQKPLLHTYTFANEPRAFFLEKLVNLSSAYFEKVFLLSSGTEATECAVKIMRMFGQQKSADKVGIISFAGAMHGRTMCAQMLKGWDNGAKWIGYKDANIFHLPFPYPWLADDEKYNWRGKFQTDLDSLINQGLKIDKLCGFMIEAYLGWGAIFYPKEYIAALYEFAKENGLVVTFDEIQAGIGRTGKFFAFEHYDVKPDMVCLGKGLSSSLPLSAVLGKKEYLDIPEFGSMSSTHSGNPLCCAAGLANLEYIEKNGLVAQSAAKGEIMHNRLNALKKRYPERIKSICGQGLVAGIIMQSPETFLPDSQFPNLICELAMEKGLLLVHTGRESIKLGPPLTIKKEILLEGLDVLEECFDIVEKRLS